MKQEYIDILVKTPGSDYLKKERIKNDLHEFQRIVGGYIETLQPTTELVAIVNEEGLIRGLPYNMTWCGAHLFGTIIFCGVDGEEFTDIPENMVDGADRWFGLEVME